MAQPTVADVLDLEVVRDATPVVLAGAEGLGRIVRWAHSSDLTDIARLLRAGDLVLTTGTALPEDAAAVTEYVRRLVGVGAAGLVVELSRRWTSVPAPYVAVCDECSLPLVGLRREARFAAIVEEVGRLVSDDQLADLRSSEEIHRTFTALSLSGATFDQILAEIHRMVQAPVVLENLQAQILGYELGAVARQGFFADWVARSRSVPAAPGASFDRASGWLTARVGARGRDWGRLVVVTVDPPRRRDIEIAERGAATLALERLATRDRDSLERQAHRILLGLLRSDAPDTTEVAARCEVAGFPIAGREFSGLVVRPSGSAATGPGLATSEVLREIADSTSRSAQSLCLAVLVAIEDGSVVALVAHPPGAGDTVVDRLAAEIHRAVARGVRALTVHVAAGTPVDRPAGIARTMREAAVVADAATRGGGVSTTVARLVDVRLRGLLVLLDGDERVQDFASRELGPVLRHDRANGGELETVLRAFVRHGGNKTTAAAALHLSRPAFYDRLARLERVLGVALDDAESLVSLSVALMVRDLDRTSRRSS